MTLLLQALANWHAGHAIVYAVRLAVLKSEILKLKRRM